MYKTVNFFAVLVWRKFDTLAIGIWGREYFLSLESGDQTPSSGRWLRYKTQFVRLTEITSHPPDFPNGRGAAMGCGGASKSRSPKPTCQCQSAWHLCQKLFGMFVVVENCFSSRHGHPHTTISRIAHLRPPCLQHAGMGPFLPRSSRNCRCQCGKRRYEN